MTPLITLIRNSRKPRAASEPFGWDRIEIVHIRNYKTRTISQADPALPPHQIHDDEWLAVCKNLGRTIRDPKPCSALLFFADNEIETLQELIGDDTYLIR